MPGLQANVPPDHQSTSVRDIFQPAIGRISVQLQFTNISRQYSLLEHASNKHNKGLADCFPGVSQ